LGARYKIIEEGNQLPPGLIPDGTTINDVKPIFEKYEKEL